MLNGNGSVFYDYYNRAEWFMENGGPDNDPNYQMGVLNFIKDDNGNPQKMTVSMKYNDECVTAINANCSEDKIKTILTFIDYFYSEEGEILANYGVEGESFKDTNGDKEFIVDYQTEEATPAGEKRWSFLSDRFTVCKPVDNEAFFKWNAPLIAEATGRLYTDENLGTSYVLKFTDDQSKEVTNLLASVFDAQMSGIAQFIDGARELTPDNWAAFQQEMNDLACPALKKSSWQLTKQCTALDALTKVILNNQLPTRQTAMRRGCRGKVKGESPCRSAKQQTDGTCRAERHPSVRG